MKAECRFPDLKYCFSVDPTFKVGLTWALSAVEPNPLAENQDVAVGYLHLISSRKTSCYRKERQMNSFVRSSKEWPVTLL